MGTLAIPSLDDRLRAISRSRQGLRTALVVLLVVSLIGTGVSVALFFVPGAVVAAMFVGLFYGMLITVGALERHALHAAGGPARPAAEAPEVHEIAADPPATLVVAERAGLRTALFILVPLVVAAPILAGMFVGWKVIGLGALAFFAIMVFMGAPVWLAALEDEIEEEEEKEGFKQEAIR